MNRDVKREFVSLYWPSGGADMASSRGRCVGNVPLQNTRADVDFAKEKSKHDICGVIGIKVWIYRGMKFDN